MKVSMQNFLKMFCIFFVLGLLIYFNSFNNKFMLDDTHFLNNPLLNSSKHILSQWNPYIEQSVGVVDLDQGTGYYRPMQNMVMGFCYDAFKNNFWKYHLFNLFFFILAVALIYLLILRIFNNYDLAFVASFFYLIHPINGIIVNYISASVFPLQLIFMLASILLLWESLERHKNRLLYFLSLLVCFFSLFWHETGIMAPFYITSIIVLFGKDTLKKKIICLIPYFLIVFFYLVFRANFIDWDKGIINQLVSLHSSPLFYLSALFQIDIWYILQLFYPNGVVMIWAAPIFHQNVFWSVLGLCGLFVICIIFFVRFSKERIMCLALIWILIGFAPACLAGFRNLSSGALIEPHWFIFSSIGFFILTGIFYLKILGRYKLSGLFLFFCIVIIWGSISHANNKLWTNEKTYVLYWAQKAPNYKTTFNYLSRIYQSENNFKEAEKYFKLASVEDNFPFNHQESFNAMEYIWNQAELYYRNDLIKNPQSSVAYYFFANLYVKRENWNMAKLNFFQCLNFNPYLLDARVELASIFLKEHKYQKAIDLCLKNLEIKENDPDTLLKLVEIFAEKKDFNIMKKYALLIINQSVDPQALTNVGIYMSKYNFYDIAFDSYEKAIRLSPHFKSAYLNAGKLFGNLGKYDEAIRLWKIGSSIDPSDQRFKADIEKAVKLNLSYDSKT